MIVTELKLNFNYLLIQRNWYELNVIDSSVPHYHLTGIREKWINIIQIILSAALFFQAWNLYSAIAENISWIRTPWDLLMGIFVISMNVYVSIGKLLGDYGETILTVKRQYKEWS